MLHRGCIMLHRGCIMLHRGCIVLHKGCIMLHKGCIILHMGCVLLHGVAFYCTEGVLCRTGKPTHLKQVYHLKKGCPSEESLRIKEATPHS